MTATAYNKYNNNSESCPFGCNGHLYRHLLSLSAVMTMSVFGFLRLMMGAEFIDCPAIAKVGKEL